MHTAEIMRAPSGETIVPLSQTTPARFECRAQGPFVFWNINGEEASDTNYPIKNPDISFPTEGHDPENINVRIIYIEINISIARNRTRLRCQVRYINNEMPTELSDNASLIIAGKFTCLT